MVKDKPSIKGKDKGSVELSKLAAEGTSPNDAKRAIEELHTYQIELEIQNEQLRATQDALTESRDRYVDLYNSAPSGYLTINDKKQIIEANKVSQDLLNQGLGTLINKPFTSFIVNEYQDEFYFFIRNVNKSPNPISIELQLENTKGSRLWVRVVAVATADGRGEIEHIRLSLNDICEEKKAEHILTEQRNLLRSLTQSTPDLISFKDTELDYRWINPAYCEFLGKSEKDILGVSDFDLFPEEIAPHSRKKDEQVIASGVTASNDEEWISVEGEKKWFQVTKTPIYDENGNIAGILCTAHDISQHKEYEQQIWHRANYDALTLLPNRTLFLDRLEQAMHYAHRKRKHLAVIFVDLDRFKWVNDRMGHAAGDQLLREAATRMLSCARETDTVARISGDEFVVILNHIEDLHDVERVIEKLLGCLEEPFLLDGKENARITGSAGITLYPDDGNDVSTLLKNADIAMYRAKEKGRNNFVFFTREMNESFHYRLHMEQDLRQALERQEWVLHYQPIVDLSSQKVIAVEALVRWQHPELGLLQPEQFIPLAEESGLITQLGEWVLYEAAKQAHIWQKNDTRQFHIAVNISSRQCQESNFEENLKKILADAQSPINSIRLEITESIMMEQSAINLAKLQRIEKFGVTLSLDDFGTGYSSLIQLKHCPVDSIKVEREFVRDVLTNKNDAMLVQAIIDLAHNFNIKVVAEGIESEQQLEFLKNAGADFGQGYYFSKPLPAQELELFLQKNQPASAVCNI